MPCQWISVGTSSWFSRRTRNCWPTLVTRPCVPSGWLTPSTEAGLPLTSMVRRFTCRTVIELAALPCDVAGVFWAFARSSGSAEAARAVSIAVRRDNMALNSM